MRVFRVASVLLALMLSAVTSADTIEVDVHGLTCAFCVDSLQRQLKKLPHIKQVDVSLKSKKVRIVASAEHMDIARIRPATLPKGARARDPRRLQAIRPPMLSSPATTRYTPTTIMDKRAICCTREVKFSTELEIIRNLTPTWALKAVDSSHLR